ncbi:excisionase family DNA-binding protein [Actinoplanes aureus]|uniref:Excisionase family DNA-binding protein n=1 Tax=Actinoplanes aureus TaxID=2792083 RepID=A0A931C5U9_9ACTN|nr:excisionase family DNA-binding protein [Actinoplanes aureus]MBG0560696.1 excisionase family DNA-binding protein [Actinoplanes aureus]
MEDLELITKEELAQLFRVPKSFVDEAVTARQILFTRLGKRYVRFSRENVRQIHEQGFEPAMTA